MDQVLLNLIHWTEQGSDKQQINSNSYREESKLLKSLGVGQQTETQGP